MPSRPRDNFNISAPNACNADIADGGGSLSGSHNSCVSVSSVSVEPPEVCCGVPPSLPLPPPPLLARNLFHVQRLSKPVIIPRPAALTPRTRKRQISEPPPNIHKPPKLRKEFIVKITSQLKNVGIQTSQEILKLGHAKNGPKQNIFSFYYQLLVCRLSVIEIFTPEKTSIFEILSITQALRYFKQLSINEKKED